MYYENTPKYTVKYRNALEYTKTMFTYVIYESTLYGAGCGPSLPAKNFDLKSSMTASKISGADEPSAIRVKFATCNPKRRRHPF